MKIAYHGTPHKIDKFRKDRIGTGEGNAAFGWGFYFARSRQRADGFRVGLADGDITIDGIGEEQFSESIRSAAALIAGRGYEGAGKFIEEHLTSASNDKGSAYWQEARRAHEELKGRNVQENDGYLYQVDLNVSNDELIQWDKPLARQPETIRKALATAYPEYFAEGWLDGRSGLPSPDAKAYGLTDEQLNQNGIVLGIPASKMIASYFYRLQAEEEAGTRHYSAGQEKVSRKLNELGIKGIECVDRHAAADIDNTYYVIFNEHNIKITHVNDQAIVIFAAVKNSNREAQFQEQKTSLLDHCLNQLRAADLGRPGQALNDSLCR